MKKIIFVPIILLSIVVLIGFIISENMHPQTSRTPLEIFLNKAHASGEVSEAYNFAMENPDGIMNRINCYCGCRETNNHRNNRECFINPPQEQPSNGSFDKMG